LSKASETRSPVNSSRHEKKGNPSKPKTMLKYGEVLFLQNESEFLLAIPSGVLAVVVWAEF
jgi:hypothetical protein